MKKTILIIIGILVTNVTLFASGDQKSTLTIVVKNVKSTDGKMSVTLFNSEGNFLNEGTSKSVAIENDNTVSITFENVLNGTYAVSVIHDENENGELDTAVFGMPTEPYGFSNDARGMFGPPSFDDSKFEVNEDKTIEISVK